jgi:hypothetical protein
MQLTKTQKLLVHNVLFHHMTLPHIDLILKRELEDIMSLIQDDLSDVEGRVDDDDEEEVFVEDDDDDCPESDGESNSDFGMFLDLPPLRCTNEDGKLGTFTFFISRGELGFEFEADKEHVDSVYGVLEVTRGGKKLTIVTADDGTWTFDVSKFSKEWTSSLQASKTIAV